MSARDLSPEFIANVIEANPDAGLFTVSFEVFTQTLSEAQIIDAVDLGALKITRAIREDRLTWFIDCPASRDYAIIAEREPVA